MQSYYPCCRWILVKSNWNWSVLGYSFAGFLPFQFTHRSPSNWWVFAEDEEIWCSPWTIISDWKNPPKKRKVGFCFGTHQWTTLLHPWQTFNTFQMSPWDLTESYLWKPTNLSNKLLKGFKGSFRDNNSVETPPFTKLPSLAKLRNQGHTPKNNTSASDGW